MKNVLKIDINGLKTAETIYINGRFLCNKMDGISRFSLEICKQLKSLGLDFKVIIL